MGSLPSDTGGHCGVGGGGVGIGNNGLSAYGRFDQLSAVAASGGNQNHLYCDNQQLATQYHNNSGSPGAVSGGGTSMIPQPHLGSNGADPNNQCGSRVELNGFDSPPQHQQPGGGAGHHIGSPPPPTHTHHNQWGMPQAGGGGALTGQPSPGTDSYPGHSSTMCADNGYHPGSSPNSLNNNNANINNSNQGQPMPFYPWMGVVGR